MSAPVKTVLKTIAVTTKDALRERALQMLAAASRMRGADCLSRDQTVELCRTLGYKFETGEPTTLELGGKVGHLEVMACGVVRVNRKHCLYTDFGNRAASLDFARPSHKESHVIAPWSHRWLGFHHFLSELFPKICRLREELGPDLGGAKICYPMIHRRYEKDLLEMLDLPKEQVIDSWGVRGVVADKITIVPMGGWFQGNPNSELLRKQLLPPHSGTKGPERLYLMRGGRRRCLNDAAIIKRCEELGFVLVDESSRTIAEQMELYRDAKILFGPHGSAFTNMVWADPGAHIIEMIPTTFDVTYHAGLTKSLGHKYTRILCQNGPSSSSGVTIDFNADVEAVLRLLDTIV